MSKYARFDDNGNVVEIFDLPWGELKDHFVPVLAEQFILVPHNINAMWKYDKKKKTFEEVVLDIIPFVPPEPEPPPILPSSVTTINEDGTSTTIMPDGSVVTEENITIE